MCFLCVLFAHLPTFSITTSFYIRSIKNIHFVLIFLFLCIFLFSLYYLLVCFVFFYPVSCYFVFLFRFFELLFSLSFVCFLCSCLWFQVLVFRFFFYISISIESRFSLLYGLLYGISCFRFVTCRLFHLRS